MLNKKNPCHPPMQENMIKTFTVEGRQGTSVIHVGASLSHAEAYLPDQGSVVIITDENILRHYGASFPVGHVITIGTGEKIKTLATVEYILKEMIKAGCDRSSFLLAVGGGIVCDIAGFVASVFLRGIRFGFVSTSLLSQVDASMGGKNGVNLDAFKNMVGVFNQPEFVLCDIGMLSTLPESEIANGLAEIIKHGLIHDPALLEFIENNREKALALDRETVFRMVADSVDIKSRVVQADEREAGERRKLNFGHTIGHAFEKLNPCGHGRAVAAGMMAAAVFSRQKGYINQGDVDRIKDLLSALGLPVTFDYPCEKIIEAASRDKKKQGDNLFFVFLEQIGRARVDKIEFKDLNTFIRGYFA